ncbi:LacI family DNA-binding transcriptional regulator [Streptomyces sp. SL13]|uniref:LacI family DNA-binding transcriptional regulator n=1 Tax=Streptantibioticus silvisoli TaxID=2705255 RepID=A0AA90GW93_9ACTN|nr:LacI family DNA-binding transcriptional regulator [Streptantibioticus silvisoli]MDI5969258.1 LacI family DNA-binding transcriptional regulator [Streptantibioticus silvisoli]
MSDHEAAGGRCPAEPGRAMTMKDVAEAAGVGLGTVSRVLTGKGQASAAARERVLEAVRRLDYRPSALGRGLKLRRTDILGLIVADLCDPFYGEFAEGVLSAARTLGKHVIVCAGGEDPATEREYAEVLLQQRVDGVIAFPTGGNVDVWQGARRLGVNVVFVDRVVEALDVPTLVVDNASGSRAATEYLLALGHRRIGYLGGPPGAGQHEEGFRAAFHAAGAAVPEELVVRTRPTRESADAVALRLVRADPAPTALFAATSVLGEAALRAVRAGGLRVPRDVSVLMFDDAPWASLVSPPVTVVSRPARRMGVEAARLVTAAGPGGHPVRVLPYELVVRGSCGPRNPAAAPVETVPAGAGREAEE